MYSAARLVEGGETESKHVEDRGIQTIESVLIFFSSFVHPSNASGHSILNHA